MVLIVVSWEGLVASLYHDRRFSGIVVLGEEV